jgi:hypothetical protein
LGGISPQKFQFPPIFFELDLNVCVFQCDFPSRTLNFPPVLRGVESTLFIYGSCLCEKVVGCGLEAMKVWVPMSYDERNWCDPRILKVQKCLLQMQTSLSLFSDFLCSGLTCSSFFSMVMKCNLQFS